MGIADLIKKGLPTNGRTSDFRGDGKMSSTNHTAWLTVGVNATTREELAAIDWTQEVHGKDHPIAMLVTSEHIIDGRTGEIVATVKPGYRFWYNHSHVHVAPEHWDGKVPCRVYNEPVKL